jgi:hypothetical protein
MSEERYVYPVYVVNEQESGRDIKVETKFYTSHSNQTSVYGIEFQMYTLTGNLHINVGFDRGLSESIHELC